MEAGVVRSQTRFALGTPHCQTCVVFLGQPVPVISTPRGYALFCVQCELGRGPITVRARDASRLALRVDEPDRAAGSEEE